MTISLNLKKYLLNSYYFNFFLVAIVLLLTYCFSNGQINRDGILYLTQASYFINEDYTKALSLYNWPFYSFLIAQIKLITGFSLFYSANILNYTFFLLSVIYFYKLINLISNGKMPVLYATITILTSIKLIDNYLLMIIRDHGHWTGFLIGTYYYFKWVSDKKLKTALIWQLGFYIGFLFRPENIIFIIFIPLIHQLIFREFTKNKHLIFIQSISLSFFLIIILFLLIVLKHEQLYLDNLGRISEFYSRPLTFIENFYLPIKFESNNFYINHLLTDYGSLFKYIFLIFVLFIKWFLGLGLIHIILFGLSIRNKLISRNNYRILISLLSISAIVITINFFATYIISGRYWIISYWIIYIFSTFGVYYFFNEINFNNRIKKLLLILFVMILSFNFLNNIYDKKSNTNELTVIEWAKKNQINTEKAYFDNKRMAFYSDEKYLNRIYKRADIFNNLYDYLFITIDNEYESIESINDFSLNYKLIKTFEVKENKYFYVYERMSIL